MNFEKAEVWSPRVDLGKFLRHRRESLRPEEVGVLPTGVRRTPGLRREEVAVMAGIGLSWYTWLEQGKDTNVSPKVLGSVAEALRLTPPERAYVFRLAGLEPPTPQVSGTAPRLSLLARLVEGWMPNPAYVVDRYWNVVGANQMALSVFRHVDTGGNCLRVFFDCPELCRYYPQFEELTHSLVSQLRARCLERPRDPALVRMAEELLASSTVFERLWALDEIGRTAPSKLAVRHHLLGELRFEQTLLESTDNAPGQQIVLYTPEPGTATEEHLRRLARRLGGGGDG